MAAVPYVRPATGLVAALKSGRAPSAARTMAEYIAAALTSPPPNAVLVPVGASRWRHLQRGLDPAAELALALASLLDLDAAPALLTRRRGTRPQRGRSREERLASPPSFRAETALTVPPGPALLIDDVVTTGGTLLASADALQSAGRTVAGALCFAWTPPHP
jgi:predicted amidophosphoribosyltransferase